MGGQMARGQGSPVRDKAEWLLRFAVMSLVTPRDFRRLRREAHRWLDPHGARPLEWGELRDVQAHIQRGLKANTSLDIVLLSEDRPEVQVVTYRDVFNKVRIPTGNSIPLGTSKCTLPPLMMLNKRLMTGAPLMSPERQ